MGTNFYARIIPSEERKNKLKKAIDNNDVEIIKDMYNRLYGEATVDENELDVDVKDLLNSAEK